jgi:hypothetical protein
MNQIQSLTWERDVLDNISTELRTELEDLKAKGKIDFENIQSES